MLMESCRQDQIGIRREAPEAEPGMGRRVIPARQTGDRLDPAERVNHVLGGMQHFIHAAPYIKKIFTPQAPDNLDSKNNFETALSRRNMPDGSDTQSETAKRLIAVRVMTGRNQAAFAKWLDVSPQRYGAMEKRAPLSKEIAFLLVRKIPGLTLDWLFFGNTHGLTVDLAARLDEAQRRPALPDTSPRRKRREEPTH